MKQNAGHRSWGKRWIPRPAPISSGQELPGPVDGRAIHALSRGCAGDEKGDRVDGDRPVVIREALNADRARAGQHDALVAAVRALGGRAIKAAPSARESFINVQVRMQRPVDDPGLTDRAAGCMIGEPDPERNPGEKVDVCRIGSWPSRPSTRTLAAK